MNMETGALLVQQAALEAHYKDVESFQKAKTRSARRIATYALVAAAFLGIANVGLAWAVASMLPLTKLVPVYLLVRKDGTIDSSVSLSTLPPSTDKAVVQAAVWQYVRLREGYSYDTAQYGYDVVSGMSSATVRQNYQSWFNYPNPVSPQVTVGKGGNITISPISVAMLSPHVAQVRFSKTLQIATNQPSTTTWTATVEFQQVDVLNGKQRLANPAGVIITNYQSSEDSTQ
jgi:type IV secretion system protein VirB8